MKALTLHQPWATCIAHHGKHIENRTWAPPQPIIGQRIAIHAGKKLDREVCRRLADEEGIELGPASTLPLGAIVATARVVGWVRSNGATVDFFGVTEPEAFYALRSPWWIGPVGWILYHTISIEPVPCKGAQGAWSLPADVESAVRERERTALARMTAKLMEAYS